MGFDNYIHLYSYHPKPVIEYFSPQKVPSYPFPIKIFSPLNQVTTFWWLYRLVVPVLELHKHGMIQHILLFVYLWLFLHDMKFNEDSATLCASVFDAYPMYEHSSFDLPHTLLAANWVVSPGQLTENGKPNDSGSSHSWTCLYISSC